MGLKHTSCAIALMVFLTSMGYAQVSDLNRDKTPDFRVQVWGRQLPRDLQYRFLGRHLVLLDTRARVILDRIPYAIRFHGRR